MYANLLTSRPKLIELTFHKDRIPHGVELCNDTGQSSPIHSSARRYPPMNSLSSRLHSKRWRALGLSGAPPINEHSHSILHPCLVVVGAHVEILDT